MNVRKSNGSFEEFNPEKVKSGIYAAFNKTNKEYDEGAADRICESLVLYNGISTDEIREQVEDILMGISKRAAKAYIKYKDEEDFIKDRIRYMDEYVNSTENASTTSETDPNANVTQKNVANLDGEVYKTLSRKGSRYQMVRELKKIFPELAQTYISDIESHIIYINDEASASVKNYCEAVSLYPLVVEGTRTMDGLKTSAPRNLNSFCGQITNLTFSLASQCKGAVAFGEFFNFFDYYCVKDFGEDYTDHLDEYADSEFVVNRKTIRERIHQAYQQIVYGWNQPMGNRSSQSPFTNISYYDKNYWHAMFDDFFFPDGTQPSWERVSYLQKDFMQWFNDERSKTLLTFPVETMALLTDGRDVVDKEYKDFTAEMWSRGHSFFLYLSDSPDSLASCCFDGDVRVVYGTEDGNSHDDCIRDAYEKYSDNIVFVNGHNPYNTDSQGINVPAKFVKSTSDELYRITVSGDSEPIVMTATHDHIFPVHDGECIKDVYVKDLRKGDKLIADVPGKSFDDIEITNIERVDGERDVYCLEILDGHNPYFVLQNGLVTHNCRLRNKLDSNTFSFTSGLTGVQTGSANVITLNLSRIVQNFFRGTGDGCFVPKKREYRTEAFESYFRSIVRRVICYHIAFKNLLYNVEEKGMLTASNAGYIKMNKLYSTIGINGFNEASEFVGLKCDCNDDYKDFCSYVTGLILDEENKIQDPKYKMNIEFVPAESLGGKNYSWDKEDGYWVPENRVLYNSYFYLADDPNTSVLDKLRMHGRGFVENLTGGVGCHINLAEHLTKEQYIKLIDYAIENGTTYFTFNVPNCECASCGHIEKHHFDECPECGCTDVTDWTRIIGYLRPVSAFEKKRRIEAATRVYSRL